MFYSIKFKNGNSEIVNESLETIKQYIFDAFENIYSIKLLEKDELEQLRQNKRTNKENFEQYEGFYNNKVKYIDILIALIKSNIINYLDVLEEISIMCPNFDVKNIKNYLSYIFYHSYLRKNKQKTKAEARYFTKKIYKKLRVDKFLE